MQAGESVMERIAGLEAQVRASSGYLQRINDLEAQIAAKDQALAVRMSGGDPTEPGLCDKAWGLLWIEYWRRKKEFAFVPPQGTRGTTDRYGNKWSIETRNDLVGLESLAGAFGYDPENPPVGEFMLLHCFPNQGSYDIATVDLEKAQIAHVKAQRRLTLAEDARDAALGRNRQDLADKASQEAAVAQMDVEAEAKRYSECKAIIENAIQRYYLVPMDVFAKMDEYGVPIKCQVANVMPQKRHQNLPNYERPVEQALVPGDGEPR